MAEGKSNDTATAERESSATAITPMPAAHDTASATGSDDLYYVTPQPTGQNEKAAAKHETEQHTAADLKRDREHIDERVLSMVTVDRDAGTSKGTDESTNHTEAAGKGTPSLPSETPADNELGKVEEAGVVEHEAPSSIPKVAKTSDEQLGTQPQSEEDDLTPGPPNRHVSFAPSFGQEKQVFTLAWRRPLTDYPTLTIKPHAESASYWRLNYESKYFARLHRYSATQARVDGDFPARQVAEFKFPEFIWPGCGPTIKSEPYDEAAGPNRTEMFMKCTGWLTTRYTIDVPILGGARCTWRPVRSIKTVNGVQNADSEEVWWQPDSEVDGQPTTSSSAHDPVAQNNAKGESRLATLGDIIAQAKAYINDDNWTPYPKQQFVMGASTNSSRNIATYLRAAPWNKNAGTLSIKTHQDSSEEYIEGIVIACAAMAGMQDRMGLASSLMEASTESIMASKRKGSLPTASKLKPYIRSPKGNTAPVDTAPSKPDPAPAVQPPKRKNSVHNSLKRLSQLVPRSAGTPPDKSQARE